MATATPPLDPDAVSAWRREVADARRQIDDLERRATAPGLTPDEMCEWRRLRAFAGRPLSAWLNERIGEGG